MHEKEFRNEIDEERCREDSKIYSTAERLTATRPQFSRLRTNRCASQRLKLFQCQSEFLFNRPSSLALVCGHITIKLEMWANAQPDGRPAEYRWRPLLNAALWLTPTTRVPCSNAAKTRNALKLAGVPQTNEMISAASRPKCTIL